MRQCRQARPPFALVVGPRMKTTYLMVTIIISDQRSAKCPLMAVIMGMGPSVVAKPTGARRRGARPNIAIDDTQRPDREKDLPAAPAAARLFVGELPPYAQLSGGGHVVHRTVLSRVIPYRLPASRARLRGRLLIQRRAFRDSFSRL
jgi:hypothetical protein